MRYHLGVWISLNTTLLEQSTWARINVGSNNEVREIYYETGSGVNKKERTF